MGTHATGLEATLRFMGRNRKTRLAAWDDSDRALRITTGKCPAFWREAFTFVAKHDRDGIDVILTEVDDHGKHFYVGACHVKMVDIKDRKPLRKWFPIEKGPSSRGSAVDATSTPAEIELVLRLSHSSHLATFLLPDPVQAIATQCTAEDAPPVPPRNSTKVEDVVASTDPGDDVDLEGEMDPDAVPRWFYAEGEEVGDDPEAIGPHNLYDLKCFWKHRTINNDTRVWRQGLDGWTPIDELHVLKRVLWDYPALPKALDPADATTGNEWFVISPRGPPAADATSAGARTPVSRKDAPTLGDVVLDDEVDVDAELAKTWAGHKCGGSRSLRPFFESLERSRTPRQPKENRIHSLRDTSRLRDELSLSPLEDISSEAPLS